MGDALAKATERLLRAAEGYAARDWSLIPLKLEDKLPAVRWKRWQSQRAAAAQLRRWFANGDRGLAVVFGDVSGGLASRDFDDMAAYDAWAAQFPQLAETLPTVATRRGRHVYAAVEPGHEASVRLILGKPDGTGAISLADGELRCGVGCYSVLPPSVHPSGHVYEWIVPLPEGPLPTVDLFTSGFLDVYAAPAPTDPEFDFGASEVDQCDREDTDDGDCAGGLRQLRTTEARIRGESHNFVHPQKDRPTGRPTDRPPNSTHERTNDSTNGKQKSPSPSSPQSSPSSLSHEQSSVGRKSIDRKSVAGASAEAATWSEAIQLAIADSLPVRVHTRHKCVFELARGLKAVPELGGADPRDLKPYVRRWHELARDRIETQDFAETWIDFLHGWPRVQYPKGEEPMAVILARADASELPAVAEEFGADVGRLAALCRELQRAAGDGPFYLGCRKAGQLLGVNHATANRWLFLLIAEGVLAEVEKGTQTRRRASRYRYLAEL